MREMTEEAAEAAIKSALKWAREVTIEERPLNRMRWTVRAINVVHVGTTDDTPCYFGVIHSGQTLRKAVNALIRYSRAHVL